MTATKRIVIVDVQHRKILLLNLEFITKVNDSRNRVEPQSTIKHYHGGQHLQCNLIQPCGWKFWI